jgi:hypothetical protein
MNKENFVNKLMTLFHLYLDNYHLDPLNNRDIYNLAEKISNEIIRNGCKKDEIILIFNDGKEPSYSSASIIPHMKTDEEMRIERIKCAEECYDLYLKYNPQ